MIINGNNIEELKKFDDNYFDSIVTDPPYEIGFMGKSWDASGIANNPEMWSECLRVLKPGGYLLSFSATRTYHRMAVAIEDSGFEIRDMIEWVYGSGFPKSLNIGKAINKIDGVEFESKPAEGVGFMNNDTEDGYHPTINQLVQKGESSDRAKQWEGKGTALKPAHEPICMARKPLAEKTVAENCLKYGTGGINIDESRVALAGEWDKGTMGTFRKAYDDPNKTYDGTNGAVKFGGDKLRANRDVVEKYGRFPANLIHDNSEEVRECFPETHARGNKTKKSFGGGEYNVDFGQGSGYEECGKPYDSGNASRFFKSIIYQAKASKSERNKGCEGLEETLTSDGRTSGKPRGMDSLNPKPQANHHPTVKPVALMEYLIKMVTPTNGIVLDPFMGSGSTGVACVLNDFEFVGIDLDKDYCEIARARIEGVKETQTKMF
jgi:DNA modification methylase